MSVAIDRSRDEAASGAQAPPPHDIGAEQATLGAMLIELGAASRAMAIVREDDFYPEAHKLIFRAMIACSNRGEPVDIITVSAELRRNEQLESVGGAEYLTALINEVPTAAHVVRYATIVAEKAVLRKLISAGAEIQGLGYDNPEDVGEALDRSEQKIFEIAQRRITSDFTPIGPLVQDTFEKLDQVYRHPGYISGVPTGLSDFDKLTSGLQRGDLVIVAGRPSMGKTSLAVSNFALHAAVQHNIGTAIFSLEMARMQLAELMLCSQAQVNSWAIRRGMTREDDWSKIGKVLAYLPTAPIFIDDTPGIPIMELRSKARRLKTQHDIGLVIIDYLQLVTTGERITSESRHQEVSLIARSLKALARELNCPIVALSQLSRLVERREEKRPILSDLAESGSIEAEADLVCFLYRPSYYKRRETAETEGEQAPVQDDQPDKAEIMIAKHRNGPVGTVDTFFHPQYRRFYGLDQFREADLT